MLNRGKGLRAAVLLLGLLVSRPSGVEGADDPPKAPDARQTTETFLAAALAGRAKQAAAMGEPGSAYSREGK